MDTRDQSAKLREGPRRAFPRNARMPALVAVLLALNVAIETLLSLSDFGIWLPTGLRSVAFSLAAFIPQMLRGSPTVFELQPVTMFISYAFLHGGLVHLFLNMLALGLFGTAIARRIGAGRFAIAYALSAIAGAIAFAILGDGLTPMVGASGALFGLLGVWCCWDVMDKRFYGAPAWDIVRPLLYLLLYNLAFMALLRGQIAWEAHLGGFVAGWVLALGWGRPVYRRVHARDGNRRKGD